jgi:2,3-bisphosphoglycerate-dependent phosphoglycerate mutase
MAKFFLIVLFLLVPELADAQKVVIFVRHAERADGGAMSPKAQDDPLLSPAGEARAARLATMLADSGVRAVFATEFKRTQDTGKPLATTLGLKIQVVKGDDANGLLAILKKNHADDVVLIVGHSNTIPPLIRAFGGPAVEIPDGEFDNLFFVAPASKAFTRIRY